MARREKNKTDGEMKKKRYVGRRKRRKGIATIWSRRPPSGRREENIGRKRIRWTWNRSALAKWRSGLKDKGGGEDRDGSRRTKQKKGTTRSPWGGNQDEGGRGRMREPGKKNDTKRGRRQRQEEEKTPPRERRRRDRDRSRYWGKWGAKWKSASNEWADKEYRRRTSGANAGRYFLPEDDYVAE